MSEYPARLSKLRGIMRTSGIDIIALIPGANLRYLANSVHYLMERPIVLFIPLDEPPLAIIPKFEVSLFSRPPLNPRIVSWTDAEGYQDAFKLGLAMLNPAGKTIGVEGIRMRFFESELIRRYAPGATITSADPQLTELRIIKTPGEIACLRRAIEISEQALRHTLDSVRIGMSEIELADILDSRMKSLGSEEPSFATILHGGTNTALPHTGPLQRRIEPGDPLLIDFGAVFEGYRADITRTVFLGEPAPEIQRFYSTVEAANAAAFAAARPGVEAQSIDIAARNVLIEAGYQHLIRHRTGHGIGLETHEEPYIVEGNPLPMQLGMTFTIEPGIYELDRIGVRIEDDILLTTTGAEYLTTHPHTLQILNPL
jgi:Xaa-Pro dipeptidase